MFDTVICEIFPSYRFEIDCFVWVIDCTSFDQVCLWVLNLLVGLVVHPDIWLRPAPVLKVWFMAKCSFYIYMHHLEILFQSYVVRNHLYADDTQQHLSFDPRNSSSVINKLNSCLDNIRSYSCVTSRSSTRMKQNLSLLKTHEGSQGLIFQTHNWWLRCHAFGFC